MSIATQHQATPSTICDATFSLNLFPRSKHSNDRPPPLSESKPLYQRHPIKQSAAMLPMAPSTEPTLPHHQNYGPSVLHHCRCYKPLHVQPTPAQRFKSRYLTLWLPEDRIVRQSVAYVVGATSAHTDRPNQALQDSQRCINLPAAPKSATACNMRSPIDFVPNPSPVLHGRPAEPPSQSCSIDRQAQHARTSQLLVFGQLPTNNLAPGQERLQPELAN
ncbi:hypothetical protein B0H67DRAFT_591211 [Lasiosphaeris hirsuta]|uniref:Uncharacterized protein n=1 Tax=Lasiosphaeris hirsuta TaxID=260670 RepID=A0AA40DKP8_9PEZI|nr:hypothetical protein B0H67DRAFT_591211 [Lasiosphaeris hirsuta]